ncbi:MAG: hypothetical protein V3U87_09345 [Methylococcaceae bacterium]
MKKYKVTDVFVPGGMPQLTYVARRDETLEESLRSSRDNLCKLVTVTGPTKSGKTVLASRIFNQEETIWIDGGTVLDEDDFWSFILFKLNAYTDISKKINKSTGSEISGEFKGVASLLVVKGEGSAGTKLSKVRGAETTHSVSLTARAAAVNSLKECKIPIIIDDFHYLDKTIQAQVVRALKTLIFSGLPVIIIAIPHRRFDAIKVEKEMTGRVLNISIPAWDHKELSEIPQEGLPLLNLEGDDKAFSTLSVEAYGSPHLMQEFCRSWVNENNITSTCINSTKLPMPTHEVFHSVAKDTGKFIFDKLANGNGNKSSRLQRPLKSGGVVDLYEVTLLSLSNITTGLGVIRYDQLRSAVKDLVIDKVPRKNELVRVLTKLSSIAALDGASAPVLEWDKEDNVLHIADPFFVFYLKWGLDKTKRVPDDPVLTDQSPLGSLASEEYEQNENFSRLFDVNNRSFKTLGTKPTVLIGRRGSGKTALLRSAYVFNNECLVLNIAPGELFNRALELFYLEKTSHIFTESIAHMWERILWEYIARFIFENNSDFDVDSKRLLNKQIQKLSDDAKKSDFEGLKRVIFDVLEQNKNCILILVDSLEAFDISNEDMAKLFQGFMKFAGQFHAQNSRLDIRYAVSSEMYHEVISISSNPNKDFRKVLSINWSASELLGLVAKRYAEYLKVYELAYFEHRLSNLNLENRRDVVKFWDLVFPETVVTKTGVKENAMAFILRHTQLLPRQLIFYLNAIISRGKQIGQIRFGFSAKQIVDVVANSQYILVNEIFSAYYSIHPYAKAVCENCLPELGSVFTIGDLQRTFRRHGKKVFASDDFFEFKNMLIEIGAVGVVINESSKYAEGRFQYTSLNRLVTSTDDLLCLHPLFTETFRAKDSDSKSVYPYGAQVSERDYRDW